ncbi:ABC transporter ATP-binding protein [Clostridium sp. CCUG 7971]|uniref:ABC transporter ATP-binding protein n=1 Tax=Clostridium sp. CCUG 7971 TaxID=2811414 RepID=UPI00256FAAEE|nr:ABC transporter ATP-binding protein [Clostridium sp. CCUG 7971]
MSNSKNLKRFLMIVFKKNKFILIIAFSILMVSSILNLSMPQIVRLILDNAIVNKEVDFLLELIFLYSVVLIISVLLRAVLEYIYSKLRRRLSIQLKLKLLRHISKLSGNYYSNIKTGNLLSILESDVYIVESFGAEIIFSLVIDAITAFTSLFLLINMQLDLLAIVIVLQIIIAITQSKFTKIIATRTRELRELSGRLSNIVQEYVSNLMNVVISKSSLNFFTRYIKGQRKLSSKWINSEVVMSTNIAISSILSSLITILIYGLGGLKIIKGDMSIGELIAFQQYTGMLIGPSIRIIKSNTKLQQSLVSINRIFTILDEPVIIKQDNKGKPFERHLPKDIIFDKVSFSYDKDKIINNMSMVLKEGSITAIVGSSGCGKSTLINLLFRLWDIDEGQIIIGSTSIKDYKLKDLRKNISIVTQDLLLLDNTILNNLTLGNKNINKDYIEDVCIGVGLLDFINELQDKFNTIVGEKGVKLSGGQKQRIAIARALISNSSILVFDEATSALDNISQRNILQNISKFLNNKTVIVIAHRLSTIKNADRIYVMDKGRVVEYGSHNELLSNKSIYYNMVNEKDTKSICI